MILLPASMAVPGDTLDLLVGDDSAEATAPARALRILVVEHPDREVVTACTPALAEQLLARWAGAQDADVDGRRWLHLPLGRFEREEFVRANAIRRDGR